MVMAVVVARETEEEDMRGGEAVVMEGEAGKGKVFGVRMAQSWEGGYGRG